MRLRDCPPDDPRDERDPLPERELEDPPLLLCRDDQLRAWLVPELLPPELLLLELLVPELLLLERLLLEPPKLLLPELRRLAPVDLLRLELLDCALLPDRRC